MFEGYNIDPSCYWATDRYRELGSPTPVGTTNLPLPMTISVPPVFIETITAMSFPMLYVEKPVKAEELVSKVEGATISHVSKDFPEALIKSGKAKELRSKFS
jgi:hypothetical protein